MRQALKPAQILAVIASLFFLVQFSSDSKAQANIIYYFNPGVKLGYVFGGQGGFIWGVEASFTATDYWNIDNLPDGFVGVALDYDVGPAFNRFHLGLETGYSGVNLDVGPSLIFQDGSADVGISLIPFLGGFIGYPYYDYTFRFGHEDISEVGAYIKYYFELAR